MLTGKHSSIPIAWTSVADPDPDPDPYLSFQIKAKTLEKVLK
jgi:hypothetical protein